MSTALTLLYVPADRPDRVVKALASSADVVAVDLEDAVTADRKDAARGFAEELLGGTAEAAGEAAARDGRPTQVRINHPSTRWHEQDVAMVNRLPAEVGVRCPKVESPEQVRRLAAALPGRKLHLLVESALGVEHAFALATASEQVASLGLGEADLRSDLRVSDEAGLAWARSRIVTAARAAGLPPPMMSVYPHVRDSDGLADSCRAGRTLGFLGRTAIHPRQLATIREAFLPSADEIERASRVLEGLATSADAGVGVFVLEDGSFIDQAMAEQARAVLDIAPPNPAPRDP